MSEQPPELDDQVVEPYPWLPSRLLAGWLKLTGDTLDDVGELVRTAAAHYCEEQRLDLMRVVDVDGVSTFVFAATPSIQQAGLIAAGRLWERRNTPAGLASFAEFGAADILRVDPDVARLLGTGRHARPAVG